MLQILEKSDPGTYLSDLGMLRPFLVRVILLFFEYYIYILNFFFPNILNTFSICVDYIKYKNFDQQNHQKNCT